MHRCLDQDQDQDQVPGLKHHSKKAKTTGPQTRTMAVSQNSRGSRHIRFYSEGGGLGSRVPGGASALNALNYQIPETTPRPPKSNPEILKGEQGGNGDHT